MIAVNGGWTIRELIDDGINAVELYIGKISIERMKNAGITYDYIKNINTNNITEHDEKQKMSKEWWRRGRSNSFTAVNREV